MLFNNNTKSTTRLLLVLGCSLLVATTIVVGAANIPESVKKAAEEQVVAATTEQPCVDAYILKSECIEWAWWGEWYVFVQVVEVSKFVKVNFVFGSFRFHSRVFHFCSFVGTIYTRTETYRRHRFRRTKKSLRDEP